MKTILAVNTDFNGDTGSPEQALRAIAEAGFTHLHWCHHWCTDFLYGKYEIAAIKDWMKELNLTLLDVHGTGGQAWQEKSWFSLREYERKAGVEIVTNRLEMLSALEAMDGGTLIMHFPVYHAADTPEDRKITGMRLDSLRRSLDEIIPLLEKHNRKIALENMWGDTWETMDAMLKEYPAERIGICYDSGHANSKVLPQMESLDARKNRLEAVHLHDNNGEGDQHQPPRYGTVNWKRLAEIIGTSAYIRPLSFEITIGNTPFMEHDSKGNPLPGNQVSPKAVKAFLADAHLRALDFNTMVEKIRNRA